jgi:hypothetical protein
VALNTVNALRAFQKQLPLISTLLQIPLGAGPRRAKRDHFVTFVLFVVKEGILFWTTFILAVPKIVTEGKRGPPIEPARPARSTGKIDIRVNSRFPRLFILCSNILLCMGALDGILTNLQAPHDYG